MRCPDCGEPARVVRTVQLNPGITERERRCEQSHSIVTTEVMKGWRLEEVRISRRGSNKLQDRGFDHEVLRNDLRQATLNTLNEQEIRQITNAVAAELRDYLAEVADGQELPPQVLADEKIIDTTENALRRSDHRLAHVLYALSLRGRRDRPGLGGWKGAEDVLNWLYEEEQDYIALRTLLPERPFVPRELWAPVPPNSVPVTVVKRGNRGEVPFDMKLFRRGIEKAMHGRENPQRRSRYIAQLVVRNLHGQKLIHSSQLAVGVLDTLRRVDDIAYLRWATLLKRIRLVSELNAEALGLISDPSPVLRFEEPGRPVQTRLATEADDFLFE